nr:ABC transporter G family member 34-like [Solanum lycopersicum]
MEATLSRGERAKSLSRRSMSRRGPGMSSSSWTTPGVSEMYGTAPGSDVFERSRRENDDEQELKWAAIERLPTYDRLRKGILKQTLDDGETKYHEVDLVHLGLQDRKQLLEGILKLVEEDNERFLRRYRDRTDR